MFLKSARWNSNRVQDLLEQLFQVALAQSYAFHLVHRKQTRQSFSRPVCCIGQNFLRLLALIKTTIGDPFCQTGDALSLLDQLLLTTALFGKHIHVNPPEKEKRTCSVH